MFDQPTGKIRLYVDGKRAAETAFDAPWQAGGALMVGGSKAHGALSDFWPGAIDAATMYQAALTDDEIERLHRCRPPNGDRCPCSSRRPTSRTRDVSGERDYPITNGPAELGQMTRMRRGKPGKPDEEVALRFSFNGDRCVEGFVLDDGAVAGAVACPRATAAG